jgi:hypothetical protein
VASWLTGANGAAGGLAQIERMWRRAGPNGRDLQT